MTRDLWPYASFAIKDNGINFYNNEIFPIDSMLTNKDQDSAMLLEM